MSTTRGMVASSRARLRIFGRLRTVVSCAGDYASVSGARRARVRGAAALAPLAYYVRAYVGATNAKSHRLGRRAASKPARAILLVSVVLRRECNSQRNGSPQRGK